MKPVRDELARTRAAFDGWRRPRTDRSRIAPALWDAALALLDRGYGRRGVEFSLVRSPPKAVAPSFNGRVMKGWLYVMGESTKKGARLRTWIARGETALRAPTRKPRGGTR